MVNYLTLKTRQYLTIDQCNFFIRLVVHSRLWFSTQFLRLCNFAFSYTVDKPSSEDRSLFFDRLIEAALSVISGLNGKPDGSQALPELPKVVKEPTGPKPAEIKAKVEAEQHALRRLRMCLRDVCNR